MNSRHFHLRWNKNCISLWSLILINFRHIFKIQTISEENYEKLERELCKYGSSSEFTFYLCVLFSIQSSCWNTGRQLHLKNMTYWMNCWNCWEKYLMLNLFLVRAYTFYLPSGLYLVGWLVGWFSCPTSKCFWNLIPKFI